MIVSLLLALAIAGRTEVWTEPSTVRVFSDSNRSRQAEDGIRLYAALGERESFQVCVQARKRVIKAVKLDVAPLDKEIGSPKVWRVGYLRIGSGPARRDSPPDGRWPDPLLHAAPISVPPHETRSFWVTYHIPFDAKPGIHKGEISLVLKKHIKRVIPVTIEVFAFRLPETPSLASLVPLDRHAIARFYGINGESLKAWKPIYDALIPYRLSFSITMNGNLVSANPDGGVNVTAFKKHLDYLLSHDHMNTVELGVSGSAARLFRAPLSPSGADPLRPYLRGMMDWLAKRDSQAKACLSVAAIGNRNRWTEIRKSFERVQRAEPRVRRLLRGSIHPYWDRYADIWATPFAGFDPAAAQRLKHGVSLAAPPRYPAISVTASSAGHASAAGWQTLPSDAYDGSVFSYWCSAAAPDPMDSQWLRIDFAEAVPLRKLTVVWEPGMESNDLRLDTSYNGRSFSSATTQWTFHNLIGPGAVGWSEGTLAMEKRTLAIRLEFRSTLAGGPVGVREVLIGTPPKNTSLEPIQAPALWLYVNTGSFPSLAVDAAAAEPRLIPWLCWREGFTGFVYDAFNIWPSRWKELYQSSPEDWEDRQYHGATTLAYPGPKGLFPSIRLETLSEGIEDYEYLVALRDAVRSGRLGEAEARELYPKSRYVANPKPGLVDNWVTAAMTARVRIGRALTRLAEERN